MSAIGAWLRDHRNLVMIGALVALLIAGGMIALRTPGVKDALAGATEWLGARGHWGVIGVALAVAVAALLMLPIWPLHVVAGLVYGLPAGFAIAIAGNTIGGVVGFVLGRTLLRHRFERHVRRGGRLSAISKAMDLKAALLIQLSPLVPFGASSYAFGVTRLPLRRHALAVAIGGTPGALFNVWLGSAVGGPALRGEASEGQWGTWVGLAVTGVAMVLLSLWARRAMRDRTSAA